MYIKENKTILKEELIDISLKIINEFNSILNNDNLLISKINTLQFSDKNLQKKFDNYYNLFKILNSQNIKQDILYFYKLGLNLIDEKLLNTNKAKVLLKNIKLTKYLEFNLSLNNDYNLTNDELIKIKKINYYFNKMLEINETFVYILTQEKTIKKNNNKVNINFDNNLTNLELKQRNSILKKLIKINKKAEEVIFEISTLKNKNSKTNSLKEKELKEFKKNKKKNKITKKIANKKIVKTLDIKI